MNTATRIQSTAQPVAACPVCNSDRISPFMTAADNGHLRRRDIKLPVYRCRSCDVFFLNPPPRPEIGREYFAEAYANHVSGNIYYSDDFKDRTSRVRLDLLSRQAPEGRRLLDVGCGKGQFVHLASNSGWEAWGVELDEGACAYANEKLGLPTVLNGSLDHPDLPDEFDVITLWDVIEHVPDPVDIFRQVALRLRPGGLVAVRTANIRSWAFDRHRTHWWAFGSDHRFYFSPHSLGVAMGKAGLNVAAVVNGELAERPDKRPTRDVSETSLVEGLRSVSKSPAKIAKVGRYGQNLMRRIAGDWRYGTHYRTSIMTVIGAKHLERPGAMPGQSRNVQCTDGKATASKG